MSNIYSSVEHDNALGLKGAQTGITNASNYSQANVQNENNELRCDADGDGKPDLGITDIEIVLIEEITMEDILVFKQSIK